MRVFREALNFVVCFCQEYEIIMVDDGSTDDTAGVMEKIKHKHPQVILIKHPKNLGIGWALRNGYQTATKDFVCAIPGDGQFDINELKQVRPFLNNIYFAFYRQTTNYSAYRSILTWMNRLFNQHVLSVYLRDVNWIKVYRKEQLLMVDPVLKSSLIESEICAKLYKAGVYPLEIPSHYLPRAEGTAKGGSWNTLRKVIREIIKLWWVVTRYKYTS